MYNFQTFDFFFKLLFFFLRSTDHKIKANWDDVKLDIMEKGKTSLFVTLISHSQAYRAFMNHNFKVGKLLVLTNDRELRYGLVTMKTDEFWGYASGKGENHIGQILSKIREELKVNFIN